MKQMLLLLAVAGTLAVNAADNYLTTSAGADLNTPAIWSEGAVPTLDDTAFFTNPVSVTYNSSANLAWGGMVGLGTGKIHNLTHNFAPDPSISITITGDVHVGRIADRSAKFSLNQGNIFITNDQMNATLHLGLADQSALGSFSVNNGTMVVDRVIAYTNGPSYTAPFQGGQNRTAFIHVRNGGYLMSDNLYLSDWLISGGTLTRVHGVANTYVEMLLSKSIVVTGPGTMFRNRVPNGNFRPNQHVTQVIVSNGATLWLDRVNSGGMLNAGRGFSNCIVLVTHDSVLTTAVDIAIGTSGANNEINTLAALMIVTDNGRVYNHICDVGSATSDNRLNMRTAQCAVTVKDGGQWNNNVLRVGTITSGGLCTNVTVRDNTATAAAGGVIRATNVIVGFINPVILANNSTGITNENNRVVVDGGTLLFTNPARTANVQLQRGPLVAKAGLAEVDRLQMLWEPAGTPLFEGGTLQVNTLTTNNNGRQVAVDNGTLFLAGGTHNFVDGLHIGEDGVLKGTGKVIGAVTNDGTVAPGASIGTLPVVGTLVMGDGATYQWEITTTSSDVLSVDGDLIFDGAATLVVTNLEPMSVPAGSTSTLFTVTGTYQAPSSWNYVLPTGWSVAFISELTPGTVSISLIPEPAAVLAGALVVCLARRRR